MGQAHCQKLRTHSTWEEDTLQAGDKHLEPGIMGTY